MAEISLREAVAIGIGGMIGGGIFAVLGLSLELAGTAAPIAFFISGVVALLTAYSYAKLTRRYPSSGGTVEYIVKAFGTGVLSGGLNILLLFAYTVMLALYAYAFGAYLAAATRIALRPLFSAIILVLFVLVNALGAYVTGRVEDLLVYFKVSVLLLVAGAGLSYVDRTRFDPSSRPSVFSIIAGGFIIFLAYEGFELISNASADADPDELPKAYYISVGTVTVIYVLIAIVTAGVLTPELVKKARDYALAEAAKPSLGELGFLLVSIAALVSTASAINATLYGVTGISYVVAKYGYVPKRLERPIRKRASEGLAITAILALILTMTPLESISSLGSISFLLIFTAVNIAAYKLRKNIGANGIITLLAAVATISSLSILVLRMAEIYPKTLLLLIAIPLAFLIERIYRRQTGRTLAPYVDERLKEREKWIRSRKEWFPRLRMAILKRMPSAEVYAVGSVVRGEFDKAHDFDVLIVTSRMPDDVKGFEREVMEEAEVSDAPIDFHYKIRKNSNLRTLSGLQ